MAGRLRGCRTRSGRRARVDPRRSAPEPQRLPWTETGYPAAARGRISRCRPPGPGPPPEASRGCDPFSCLLVLARPGSAVPDSLDQNANAEPVIVEPNRVAVGAGAREHLAGRPRSARPEAGREIRRTVGLLVLSAFSPRGRDGNTVRTRTPQVRWSGLLLDSGGSCGLSRSRAACSTQLSRTVRSAGQASARLLGRVRTRCGWIGRTGPGATDEVGAAVRLSCDDKAQRERELRP